MARTRSFWLAAALLAATFCPAGAFAATNRLTAFPGSLGDVELNNFTDGTFFGPGDSAVDPDSHLGDDCEFIAIPASGAVFINWTHASGPPIVPGAQSSNQIVSVTMDGFAHTIRANFKQAPSTLTVSSATPARGDVSTTNRTDNAFDGPAPVAQLTDVDVGETIEVRAHAFAGFQFSQWSGDIPAGQQFANPAVFQQTVAVNRNISAIFVAAPPGPVNLTIISTNEIGAVVGNPQPFSGSLTTNSGATVRFTVTTPWVDTVDPRIRAIAQTYTGTGSIGSGAAGTGDAGTYTITANSSIEWTWRTEFQLTLVINGIGNVSVSPAGPWYARGTVVNLLAIQTDPGNPFQTWGGDITGLIVTNTVVMNGPRTVEANFGPELDSDGDGLPDRWEKRWGLDHLSATGVSGAFGDPDNDGLPNILEYQIFLSVTNAVFEINPIHADSDGDGMHDGYEFFHIGPTNQPPGQANNFNAPVSATGVNGPNGNQDQDFLWNTLTGYETTVGLRNIDEYVGPDGIVPGTWFPPVMVPTLTNLVHRYTPNPLDTLDQSFSDTTDSEIFGGNIVGDGFDDGFEWTWDVWQGIHAGDPTGDPLGRRVPSRSGVAGLPVSAAVANFGGSAAQDLLIVNQGTEEMVLMLGMGNGTFVPPAPSNTFNLGTSPRFVVAADVDQDGLMDAIVANWGDNTISVFRNLGAANFAPPVNYAVGMNPIALAVGRFTPDDYPDIAVVNEGADTVSILHNDLAGNFAVSQTLVVGTSPSHIAAGQLVGTNDAVAVVDLLVANRGSDNVMAITNNGAGVFAVLPAHPVGVEPVAVVIAEFNGDSTNDFAVACYGSSQVRSYRGLGDGTFASESIATVGVGAGPRHLALGHFDAIFPFPNANVDLVTPNELLNTASILLGAGGSVSFSQFATLDVGNAPVWAAVGRFNGDNLDDLVILNRDDGTASIYLGRGNGSFAPMGAVDTTFIVVDRRFNPAQVHVLPPDGGNRDYDLLYDQDSGRVADWFTDEFEYSAWDLGTYSVLRREFPNRRRSTHPFLWDADFDGLPDGWEVSFGYDPWDFDTNRNGVPDGEENPDGDWYARAEDGGLVYLHNEVYGQFGYNPGTGYGYTIPRRPAGPNSAQFSNYQELIGPRQLPALVAFDPEDTATHPFKIDSDGDGIWDTWEWYIGMDAHNPADGGQHFDLDGLSNFREWESYMTSSNVMADRFVVLGWANKTHPTDPWDPDTDRDQLGDGEEQFYFNFMVGTNGVFTSSVASAGGVPDASGLSFYWQFGGGGLNPTTVDTDRDWMPDGWEAVHQGALVIGVIEGGPDGTLNDAFQDSDGDGLLNYQEYMMGSVYAWRPLYNNLFEPGWTPGRGLYGYEPFDFFNPTLSGGGQWFIGPGGRDPHPWDPQSWVDPLAGVPFFFMTGVPFPWGLTFATLAPNSRDTDLDGLDDYWETYHGINPMFGVIDEFGFLAVLPDPLDPDIRKYPWISGYPLLDVDQDEIFNMHEGIVPNVAVPPPYHHTDPSPHWMTDTSSTQSFVNLYYWLGTFFGYPGLDWWYWGIDPGRIPPFGNDVAPSYMFDFELNEGFDTDNDGFADRAELVNDPASPGATDPLNSETPIKRRALYLNGDAYARTRHDYLHFGTEFRTFTIEGWLRPERAATGAPQLMTERSMMVPQGNLLDATPGVRLNWQIGIDGAGIPFVRYNGAAKNIIFVEAKASPAARMRDNEWSHLAATYGGEFMQNGFWQGMLKLYKDGLLVAATPSSEIPANGYFGPISCNDLNMGFAASAAMIAGAGDNNPGGWVGNEYVWVGPLAIIPLNNELFFGPPMPHSMLGGWIDEFRVWDGVRSQSEIQANMRRSFNRVEAATFYGIRPTCVDLTDAQPAGLRYAYSFDDLPDPDHTPVSPDGFNFLNMRPPGYAHVPWWGKSVERSMVYTDYKYIPWIENKVNHRALNPPRDTTEPHDPVTNAYANTANPYGFLYGHNANFGFELHPNLPGTSTPETSHQYNNMLPLRWAAADEDVEMWDGSGIPSQGRYDSDGDGLPDWWEERYGLDPLNPTGDHGAFGDPDGDGLWNITEYLALGPNAINIPESDRFNPFDADSNGDGILDADEDSDGDTLSNLAEQNRYRTHPGNPDTDDDGTSDGVEVNANIRVLDRQLTNPLRSVSPSMPRSLLLTGTPVRLVDPIGLLANARFNLSQWTLECWVRPMASETGDLILRVVEGSRTNFSLRLDGNVPKVHFTAPAGVQYQARALEAIKAGEWTHLAGVWNPDDDVLALYVNGALAKRQSVFDGCAMGPRGDVFLGGTVNGHLDEVRIWGAPRTPGEVAETTRTHGAGLANNYADLGSPFDIMLVSGKVTPSAGLSALQGLPVNTPTYLLAQFNARPSEATRAALEAEGIEFVNYVNPLTRTIRATPAQLLDPDVKALLRWAGRMAPEQKMALEVGRPLPNISPDYVLVNFFEGVTQAQAMQAAASVGGIVKGTGFVSPHYLLVQKDEAKLRALAERDVVALIMSAPIHVVNNPNPPRMCGGCLNGDLALAPFVAVSVGWDGPGLGSADLKYYFANATPDLPVGQQRDILRDQLRKWADFAALTFTETMVPGESKSFDITFGAHPMFPFDGPGGVLAYAFFPDDINPEPVAGDTHFDPGETWQATAGGAGFDLRQVALHEFGHALGLGHSSDPSAIMFPFYNAALTGDPQLAADDVAGIQSIYGLPVGDLVAWYHFDDGENTNLVFKLDGNIYAFGAEDATKPIQYEYAITGVTMTVAHWVDMYGDSDGDGIPDLWEIAHGLDPKNPADASEDPDGDGLTNLSEYQAGTDPHNADTNANGILDPYEDSDCDGLSNIIEQDAHRTHPGDPDTDDDGISDGQEVNVAFFAPSDQGGRRRTDPVNSASPMVSRSMRMNGIPVQVRDPVEREPEWRFDRSAWTVEAWVYADTASQTGPVLTRVTESGQTNFCLRFDANIPSVLFTSDTKQEHRAAGLSAIPAGTWTHVAGVWDRGVKRLHLYVNGVRVRTTVVPEACAQGRGKTFLGSTTFMGNLDEVRIWGLARTEEEIHRLYNTIWWPPKFSDGIDITPSADATALWQALLGEPLPPGVSQVSVQLVGAAAGADSPMALYQNFPTLPGSVTPKDGVLITSGLARDAAGPNASPSTTTALGLPGDGDLTSLGGATFDAVGLIVTFRTDATIEGLSLDFLFGSEEFPEFVGTAFNDPFAVILNGQNITFDQNGNPITVNNNFFLFDNDQWHPNHPATAGKKQVDVNLEYDGLTPLLKTNKKLTPGLHRMKIMIADAGDSTVDSGAFVSNLRFKLLGPEGTSQSFEDIIAYYPFDDGQNVSHANCVGKVQTRGAEDYIHLRDWRYAVRGVTFDSTRAATLDGDYDGDGMADVWERAHGLDPRDASDAWQDPDRDGLNNLAEFRAGTDPNDADTNGNGLGDYFDLLPGGLSAGELYDDGDGLPDWWELLYPGPAPNTGFAGLSPFRYDAHKDPDKDGWSNLGEYMGAGGAAFSTDPLNPNSVPKPATHVTVSTADPFPATGEIRVEFFTTSLMDQAPVAVAQLPIPAGNVYGMSTQIVLGSAQAAQVTILAVGNGAQTAFSSALGGTLMLPVIIPGSVTIVAGNITIVDNGFGSLLVGGVVVGTINYGNGAWSITFIVPPMAGVQITATYTSDPASGNHLHEKPTWAIAYVDENGNGALDFGEMAGVAHRTPVNVTWGASPRFEFTMTRSLKGYARFSWPWSHQTIDTVVYVNNLSIGGNNVLSHKILGPRRYFHEMDVWNEGKFGLQTGSYVAKPTTNGITSSANWQYFTVLWGGAPTAPQAIAPRGSTHRFVFKELEFSVDGQNSSAVEIQVSNTVSKALMLNTEYPLRYTFKDHPTFSNVYRHVLRTFNHEWPNGEYKWRVRSSNPGSPGQATQRSAWTAWESFTLDIRDVSPVSCSANGSVYYYGKVSGGNIGGVPHANLPIIVEAHRNASFSDDAENRHVFAGASSAGTLPGHKGNYGLYGLRNGAYYLMAYIDSNGNGKPDYWEPMGVLRDDPLSEELYRARVVDLTGPGAVRRGGLDIVIRDRDTDDDGLPDGWEYQYFATLSKVGSDPSAGGITVADDYAAGTNPLLVDTDGDGLSDKFEISIGSNPLVANSDDDGDGLPNHIEIAWGGSLTTYDPYHPAKHPKGKDLDIHRKDTDGDGVHDLMEVAAGSDPRNPNSTKELHIARIRSTSAGDTVLQWSYAPNVRSVGLKFRILASSDLKTWVELPGSAVVTTGTTSGTVTYTNTSGVGPFYKLGISVK